MTALALKRPNKGPTRPEVATDAANDMRDACERLARLYRGLSAPGVLTEELKHDRLPDPAPSIEAVQAAAKMLERRIGVESLMYHGLEAGDDSAKTGLQPLRHWQFLSWAALRVADDAEQAFALDLPESAAQLFVHSMDLLARIALELVGDVPPPRPKGSPSVGDAQH